jgi:hypothetical protein
VTSLVNANHDCMDNETAVKISKSFINKYINIEHDRRTVVGVITNAGFSTFKDNQIVEASALEGNNDPYNMSFCGVVWKAVDPYFADYISESSDPDSWEYKKVSASWEIGFNEWSIARGSRNLAKAEIINDPKEVEALSKYLVDEGGSGFDENNQEVYRIIKGGDVTAFGLGLTRNPAASVCGIQAIEKKKEDDMMYANLTEDEKTKVETVASAISDRIKENEARKDLFNQKEAELLKKDENNQKIISQYQKNIVKARKNMKKFKDAEALIAALDVTEASVATPRAVQEFIEDTLVEAGKAYDQLKKDKEVAAQEADSFKKSLEDSVAKVTTLESQIKALQDEALANKKQAVFQDRMSAIAEKYNLTPVVQKKVAKDIRDLSDEDYKVWLDEDAPVVLASCKKEVQASKEEEAEAALKSAQANVTPLPNAGGEEVKTKVAMKAGEHFDLKF